MFCVDPMRLINQSGGTPLDQLIKGDKGTREPSPCPSMALAETMVDGWFVPHPAMNPQYLYFHSENYGNPNRIQEIKEKAETLIIGGNMFYINY